MIGTDGGWIKLHRRFLRSAIWQNPNVARFWTWCLLKATHDGYTTTIGYRKVALEPGQFVFTRPLACTETLLSEKTVRLCVEMLKSGDTPEIGLTKGHNFSVVTILKWASYQGGNGSEGRQTADGGPAKGRLINKEGKNVKKQTGVATASDPTESPTWKEWVAACRAVCRDDPAPSDGAIKAAKTLAGWHPDVSEQRRLMDAFLALDDPWVKRQGYQLAVLTKHRIEAVREIVRTGGHRDSDDDYELTGDSLAAAIECANLFGRAANE
jgi:hypothetical protein